jgi:hypothetical protein
MREGVCFGFTQVYKVFGINLCSKFDRLYSFPLLHSIIKGWPLAKPILLVIKVKCGLEALHSFIILAQVVPHPKRKKTKFCNIAESAYWPFIS